MRPKVRLRRPKVRLRRPKAKLRRPNVRPRRLKTGQLKLKPSLRLQTTKLPSSSRKWKHSLKIFSTRALRGAQKRRKKNIDQAAAAALGEDEMEYDEGCPKT